MEILSKINWVDILIAIVMLRASYLAFQKGLSHEIFPLFGSILMIGVSLRYYLVLSGFVGTHILKLPAGILDLASFVAILAVTGFVCKMVGLLLDKIITVTWHPFIEKFGGLLIGVIKASIIASMVVIILTLIPLSYLQRSVRDKSLMGMRVLNIGTNIYAQVSRFLPAVKIEEVVVRTDEVVRRLAEDKTIRPK